MNRFRYSKPRVTKKKIKLNQFFQVNFNAPNLLANCASCGGGSTGTCCYCATTLECHSSCSGCYSDARLKTNVKPITNALDKLIKLRGVSFNWNYKYKDLDGSLKGKQLGLMAQDVEKVFPELVERGSKNYRMVHYDKMTAVLVEAVKELKKENDLLKKRLSRLEKH